MDNEICALSSRLDPGQIQTFFDNLVSAQKPTFVLHPRLIDQLPQDRVIPLQLNYNPAENLISQTHNGFMPSLFLDGAGIEWGGRRIRDILDDATALLEEHPISLAFSNTADIAQKLALKYKKDTGIIRTSIGEIHAELICKSSVPGLNIAGTVELFPGTVLGALMPGGSATIQCVHAWTKWDLVRRKFAVALHREEELGEKLFPRLWQKQIMANNQTVVRLEEEMAEAWSRFLKSAEPFLAGQSA